MIQLTASIKGLFEQRLNERIAKWQGRRIAARIRVPPELAWWYWQEFGVPAERINPIYPQESQLLVYESGGEKQFVHVVKNHPGLKPKRYVASKLDEIGNQTIFWYVDKAFKWQKAADDPAVLEKAVVDATRNAKDIIRESMAEALPNSRPVNTEFPKQSGKLMGRKAADVFNEQASIVNLSE